jgi:hypothetical protein
MVLASTLTISIEARIVSTNTSEELWKYTGTVVVDLSGGDTGGGIGGLIAKAIIAAVNTATADYVQHAHTANKRIIHTLPFGPYHELHLKDQAIQLISQTPKQK